MLQMDPETKGAEVRQSAALLLLLQLGLAGPLDQRHVFGLHVALDAL